MNKQELAKAFRESAIALQRVVDGWDGDAQTAFLDILTKHEGVGLPSFDETVFELHTLANAFENYSVEISDLVEALKKTAPIACEVTHEYPEFAIITLPNEWQFSIGTVNRDETEQFGWGCTLDNGRTVAYSDTVGWNVTSDLNVARVIWSQILDALSQHINSLVKVDN